MKNSLKNLVSTIDYLKKEHPFLPEHVFKSLDEAKEDMVKYCNKKRCKHCDRYKHYDDTLGIWNCNECDWNG